MLNTHHYSKNVLRGFLLSTLLLAGGCAHEAAPVLVKTEAANVIASQAPSQQPTVATQVAPVAKAAPATTQDAIKLGKHVYASACARCHGVNLVNAGASTFDLRTFPLDQKARFFQSVLQGKGAMPAWQGSVTPEEVEALWAYISAR